MMTPTVVEIPSRRRASRSVGYVPYRRRYPPRSGGGAAHPPAAGRPRATGVIARMRLIR